MIKEIKKFINEYTDKDLTVIDLQTLELTLDEIDEYKDYIDNELSKIDNDDIVVELEELLEALEDIESNINYEIDSYYEEEDDF